MAMSPSPPIRFLIGGEGWHENAPPKPSDLRMHGKISRYNVIPIPISTLLVEEKTPEMDSGSGNYWLLLRCKQCLA